MVKVNVDVNKFFVCGASKVEYYIKEEFEDTKRVIRIRKSKKDRKHNGKKRTKGQTMIYITLHIKHDIIACSPEAQSEIPHFLKISKIQTKNVERGKIDTPSTQTHDRSLPCLGTLHKKWWD